MVYLHEVFILMFSVLVTMVYRVHLNMDVCLQADVSCKCFVDCYDFRDHVQPLDAFLFPTGTVWFRGSLGSYIMHSKKCGRKKMLDVIQ